MRNCTWYDGGVRAMIQSGRKIEITNNTFVRIASGLHVCTDAWWWQGETVHDVLIADNVFIDCSYGSLWGSGNAAITVSSGIQPIAAFPGRYPNSDIVIRNNRIEGSSSGAIIVQNSDRVQIAGNDCRRLCQRKAPTAAIAVSGSGHVTITGNRVEDCPAPAIKAQWVDGLECRGNTASRLGTADKHTVAVDLDHVRHADIRENTVDRSQLDAVIRQEHCTEADGDLSSVRRQEMLSRLGMVAFIRRSGYGMNGTNATMIGRRTLKGSAICVLDPLRPEQPPRVVYETREGFIFDMSPSYDGTRLVFSHKTGIDQPFHLWEIRVDGSGLRQLTGEHYHDISPAYLPDGWIVFNSTRVESFSLCQNFLAAALYVMDADGTNIRRLEYSTLCDTTPSVMSDGSILYGRWEYNDKNIFCTQALWTIHPDGTRLQLFYGNTLTIPNSMYGGKQIPGTSKVVFTMAAHHHVPVGAIGVIDASRGRENVAGLVNITPEVPYVPTAGRTWRETNWGPGDKFYAWGYTDPWPVDDRVCLVSYGGPRTEGAVRHRLYAMNYQGDKTPLYDAKELSCFNAVSLKPRPRPPILPGDVPPQPRGTGTFFVQDIYQGLLDKGVVRGQIAHLRVLTQVPKKWNTEGPRSLDEYPVMGYGTYYVKYDYGTVPVGPDGTAYFRRTRRRGTVFRGIGQRLQGNPPHGDADATGRWRGARLCGMP